MNHKEPLLLANLMIARCFTLAKIPFIGITSRNDKRLFYSKYCRKGYQLASPEKQGDLFFKQLQELVNELGSGRPLFCSNDGHLDILLRHWDEMRQMFHLVTVEKDILEKILNKDLFIPFAEEYRLPVPKTYSMEQLKQGLTPSFPVIIKPKVRLNWFDSQTVSSQGGRSYKGLLVNDEQELEKFKTSLAKENIEYVAQQFVAGPESNIVSFHSFYTEDSRPLGYFVGRKIRTYPTEYGQSCALKLIRDDYVVRESLKILERIKFKGPIKIDFKINQNTGKYYLLELNPTRYNIWHYLGARGGVNLPALAYRYMTQPSATISLNNKWQSNIRWFNVVNDFQAFRHLHKNGRLSWWEWLRTYRGRRIYQTQAFDDLKPVFYGIYRSLAGLLRRVRNILK